MKGIKKTKSLFSLSDISTGRPKKEINRDLRGEEKDKELRNIFTSIINKSLDKANNKIQFTNYKQT